jgi:hypothetical protein
LFLKLTDAEGVYDLEIKFVKVGSNEVLASGTGTMEIVNRLSPSSLQIPFPGLSLPEAGRYEFQIWANKTYLGSASLEGLELPQPEASNG